MPNKKYPCIECKKNVENEHSISCCACQRWVHKDCIKEIIYKLVTEMYAETGTHFWACEGCSLGLKTIQQQVAAQDKRIRSLEKTVSTVENVIEDVKKDTKINEEEQKKTNVRVDNVEKLVEDLKINSEDDIYKELDERAAKQSNLIVFEVPEQSADLSPAERKSEDFKIVLKIIKATGYTSASESLLKFVVRIGVWKEGSNRPICVGFRDQTDRDKVLKNSRNIASSYPDYFLSPDLTKTQIARDKKLRDEAVQKNTELTGDDAKNFIWKVIGQYGQRKLLRVKKKEEENPLPRRRLPSKRTAAEMEEQDEIMSTLGVETRKQAKKQH
jgi:hypothetical protein